MQVDQVSQSASEQETSSNSQPVKANGIHVDGRRVALTLIAGREK